MWSYLCQHPSGRERWMNLNHQHQRHSPLQWVFRLKSFYVCSLAALSSSELRASFSTSVD
uniref:Uncharacterized protein n=1 Tax=Arundo donax TaxID=35708 RepID=A0A0A9CZ83_ARUDO